MINEPKHVFISYQRDNQVFAEQLREYLHSWEYKTWMDIHDIPKGAYWPDEIDKGLQAADVVIGVLTPSALLSRNVKNEWDWAIANNKRLILLMLEKCTISHHYISINYVDFTQNPPTGFTQLKTALDSSDTLPPLLTDPYRDYLKKLYDRINQYLAGKIIARSSDNEQLPEPLHLYSERVPGAVDSLFEKRDEIDPLFVIGGIQTDEPESIHDNFEQVFKHYEGRVLLLGEPGAGKTITLLHFARDMVIRRIQDPALPLPILYTIPDWKHGEMPFEEWLGSHYGVPKNTIQVIKNGQALLLMDGLDELGGRREIELTYSDYDSIPKHLQDAIDLITQDDDNNYLGIQYDPRRRFMAHIPNNNQILVTCRVKDYDEIGQKIPLKGAIRLKPLNDEQMRAYLTEQPELLTAIQMDTALKAILTTPLLLSFFAFAYQGMTAEERQQLTDLSSSPSDLRDEIFEQYVRKRYEHEERKSKIRQEEMLFTLEEIYKALGFVAMYVVNKSPVKDNEFEQSTLELLVRGIEPKAFLEQMFKLQLLITKDNSIFFIHRLIRNHFAFFCASSLMGSNHPDWLRETAILALGKIGDTRATEPLIEIVSNNGGRIAERAIWSLGELGDKRGIGALLNALKADDVSIKKEAAYALGRIGDAYAVEALIATFQVPNEELRWVVASALVQIGTSPAMEAVHKWQATSTMWRTYVSSKTRSIDP